MAICILHLEDDLVDSELVQAALAAEGLDVALTHVASQTDYEAALRGGGIELILADYSLPGYDGGSALAFAQAAAPHIPFIFVTGVLGEEQAIEMLRRGAKD